MLFDRKYVDITVFYVANSLWSVLWWCNSSCIMFLAASFDGLRSLLVACHCQPFCSLANKLRSFRIARCLCCSWASCYITNNVLCEACRNVCRACADELWQFTVSLRARPALPELTFNPSRPVTLEPGDVAAGSTITWLIAEARIGFGCRDCKTDRQNVAEPARNIFPWELNLLETGEI